MFLTSKINANVLRVNNSSSIDADYDNFSDAQTAASDGDTLYIEGSATTYGTATITKRLVIIGTGYFLSENDTSQANKNASEFTQIYLNSGSEGTELIGLSIIYSSSSYALDINVDSISVISCYIQNSYTSTGRVIDIASGVSKITLKQNFIYGSYESTITMYGIYMNGTNNDIVVANNIILRGASSTSSTSYANYAVYMASTSYAVFVNNTIFGNWVAYNSLIINNIHGKGTFTDGGSNTITNNVSWSTYFGSTNNNVASQAYSTVFDASRSYVNDTTFYDLATSSPAIGAGTDGCDCGAFGRCSGNMYYRKSGLVKIPAIFAADVPTAASVNDGLDVVIKSKSH